MLASAWYGARLEAKQKGEATLWRRHVNYLTAYLDRENTADIAARLDLRGALAKAKAKLQSVEAADYRKSLDHTLGVQPKM